MFNQCTFSNVGRAACDSKVTAMGTTLPQLSQGNAGSRALLSSVLDPPRSHRENWSM